MHFEGEPMKMVRGSKQYLYDHTDVEYLDCISSVAHVGHCHPHVVQSGQAQMSKLAASFGWLSDIQSSYAKKLVETFPNKLSICYFVNSGSEANAVALMLARAYTKRKDVIVLDQSEHGSIGTSAKLSVCRFKEKHLLNKEEWVHVSANPDQYHGPYPDDPVKSAQHFSNQTLDTLYSATRQGRQVAAFIFEPIQGNAGIVLPPPGYLSFVCSQMRENGVLCIADEVTTGLGRTGQNYWAFQAHNIVPDIVTLGKSLGNGQPLAAVVTTKEIAESIGEFASTYGGNALSCAIGLSVFEVIHNEKLLSSATCVGRCFLEGFKAIMPQHPLMGDVRGQGLIIGVELVEDKESRKPYADMADIVQLNMRRRHMLVGVYGQYKNVVTFIPPMCITCDNARKVVATFSDVLTEIESGNINGPSPDSRELVSLDVVLGMNRDVLMSEQEVGSGDVKRRRYEDPD